MRSVLVAVALVVGCTPGKHAPPPPIAPSPAGAVLEPPLPALPTARVWSLVDPTRITVEARESIVAAGPLATSTIAITVRNTSDMPGEAELGLLLPAGAVLGRMALDVEGRWMEGEVMARAAASRIYEGIVRPAWGPRRDPALLAARGGGQWSLSVFPVPPGGERHVEVAYHRLVGGAPGSVRLEAAPPSLPGGGWVFAITPAASDAVADEPAPARIVIALDTSLSMGNAGLARGRELARAVRAAYPDAVLVTGDRQPRACTTAFDACLDALDAGGSTDLEALLALAGRTAGDGPAAVVLISDGRSTAGAGLDALRWQLEQRSEATPAALHTLAVANPWTPALQALAAAGRGAAFTDDEELIDLLRRPRAPRFTVRGGDVQDVETVLTARGPVVLGRSTSRPLRLELARVGDAGAPSTFTLDAGARGFGLARVLGARLAARITDGAALAARDWGIPTEDASMLALETVDDYTGRGIARYKAVERALEQGRPPPDISADLASRDRALTADGDGDGIVDSLDVCPGEPENLNGREDDDGCPDVSFIRVEQQNIRIVEHVYFQAGRAEIPARTMPLLAEIAAVLRDHPELRLIAVEGHTDVRERARDRLGKRRAEAVRRTLMILGVDPERLLAVDYGDTRPLTMGRTATERARNRRVELHVVLAVDGGDPLMALSAADVRFLIDQVAAAGAGSSGDGGEALFRALMRLPPSSDAGVVARRRQLAERWLATLADPDVRRWTPPARVALSADLLDWLGRTDEAARRRSELDELARR